MNAIFRELHALRFNIQHVYATNTNYSILHLGGLDGKYFVVNLFSFIFETAAYRTQSSSSHPRSCSYFRTCYETTSAVVNTIKLVYDCVS